MAARDERTIRWSVAGERDEDGLAIEVGRVVWVGRLAQDAAPRMRWELREPEAPDTDPWSFVLRVQPSVPFPPPLHRALAERLARERPALARALAGGRCTGDARLVRALAELLGPGPSPTRVRLAVEARLVGPSEAWRYVDVAMERDGRLLAIAAAGVEACFHREGEAPVAPLPSSLGRPLLLRPLGATATGEVLGVEGRARDVSGPCPVAYAFDAKVLAFFPRADAGDFETVRRVPLAHPASLVFRHGGRIGFHAAAETVVLGDSSDASDAPLVRIPQRIGRSMASEHPMRFGRFLTGSAKTTYAGVEVETLGWYDLEGERPMVPIGCAGSPTSMGRVGDELWASANGALHRARPGEPAREVAKGSFGALACTAQAVWVSELVHGRYRLVRLSREDGRKLAQVEVPLYPSCLVAIGEAVLAISSLAFALVGADGSLRAVSGRRRIAGHARLAGGDVVACASEDLLFLDREGAIVRRRTMPYDGALAGALATHALFSPCSSGWQATAPDAFHLLDAGGCAVGRRLLDGPHALYLPTAYRWEDERFVHRGLGDARALLAFANGGREVHALGLGAQATPADEPTFDDERMVFTQPPRSFEQRIVGPIGDPREDAPTPGVTIRGAAQMLFDGVYEGTVGSSPAPSVEAQDGAVVMLVRCDLRSGGVRADGDSTVVLLDCVGPEDRDDVAAGSAVHRARTEAEGRAP